MHFLDKSIKISWLILLIFLFYGFIVDFKIGGNLSWIIKYLSFALFTFYLYFTISSSSFSCGFSHQGRLYIFTIYLLLDLLRLYLLYTFQSWNGMNPSWVYILIYPSSFLAFLMKFLILKSSSTKWVITNKYQYLLGKISTAAFLKALHNFGEKEVIVGRNVLQAEEGAPPRWPWKLPTWGGAGPGGGGY